MDEYRNCAISLRQFSIIISIISNYESTNLKKIFPPAFLLLFIIAQAVLHYLLPIKRWIEYPYTLWGLWPTIEALGTVIWIRYVFFIRDTTIKPFQKSSNLITSGAFKYSRNPIYLCMAVFLVGTAILFGTASPWLVVPFFPWLINGKFIKVEEQMLEDEFGEDYHEYKAKVRRWI